MAFLKVIKCKGLALLPMAFCIQVESGVIEEMTVYGNANFTGSTMDIQSTLRSMASQGGFGGGGEPIDAGDMKDMKNREICKHEAKIEKGYCELDAAGVTVNEVVACNKIPISARFELEISFARVARISASGEYHPTQAWQQCLKVSGTKQHERLVACDLSYDLDLNQCR